MDKVTEKKLFDRPVVAQQKLKYFSHTHCHVASSYG